MARKTGSEFVANKLTHCLSGFDCCAANMGLQHDVVEHGEAWIDAGFVEEDVKAGTPGTFGLERRQQSLLIVRGSARDIDQNAFRLGSRLPRACGQCSGFRCLRFAHDRLLSGIGYVTDNKYVKALGHQRQEWDRFSTWAAAER